MSNRDPEWYFMYFRMDCDQFEWILKRLRPVLERKYVVREPLSAKLRLMVTLRFLATGDSYFTLATCYRIGISTVCKIIQEVCVLLNAHLAHYAFPPLTESTWKTVSDEFAVNWNFPHTCGAIDGKHAKIRAPNNSGSLYWCYKGYFSIVLLGIADAHYRFLYVSIGSYGSSSDGGILKDSQLGRILEAGKINFPKSSPIIPGGENIPYFFVGDEAFGLREWCQVPYAGRFLGQDYQNFNMRLSRARRVIENAFGILSARWRIFHRTICAAPETVDSMIQATVTLHNLLCTSNKHNYAPPKYTDREQNGRLIEGEWREEVRGSILQDIPANIHIGSHNYTRNASRIRDYLKDYVKGNRI
ncbi:uncharacterized protein LOC129806706 [Phlebotomus papatasi]|uniref:uncharacterized protein LOC129806706 n=1 Tax=Phlebotomus papatasi TaxID=29031 RepID=UPI002483EBE3|nr:uncharacterized protein LOC129806706 [Phlebotomus papatasi]